ncbi:MAG: transketolase C-terminal domain-containing protein [Candidatus Diapherotrites archaeon]|nr:transketolase C-terminal domain-containing protein [Candidatus Diapherotrites archaeon]
MKKQNKKPAKKFKLSKKRELELKSRELIDGNSACAFAVKLCHVESIPAFPITPQTELMEKLALWISTGELDSYLNVMESEHSVLSAAVGSEMTGVRTFVSSGSQGLMLMHEILPIASGTRMPIVMICGSRALSAPIALWPDHNDFLSCRDFGWLMMAAEINQELLDFICIAYRVAESKNVLLPALIEMDGFILSETREPVEIPRQEIVDRFLPELKLETMLDVEKPMTLGTPVLEDYQNFKEQMQAAQNNALKEFEKAFKEWKILTGRKYDFVEKVWMENAEIAIVMMGANATIAKAAVRKMRSEGKKVGLVKLRILRPWPEKSIMQALKKCKKIAVVDQNISLGKNGIIYNEICETLKDEGKILSNYIAGLGGKHLSIQDFEQILADLEKSKKSEKKWLS